MDDDENVDVKQLLVHSIPIFVFMLTLFLSSLIFAIAIVYLSFTDVSNNRSSFKCARSIAVHLHIPLLVIVYTVLALIQYELVL